MQLAIWVEDDSLSFEELHNLGAAIDAQYPLAKLSFEVTE